MNQQLLDNLDNRVLIAQAQTSQTLFTTQVPSNQNANDGVPYALGMKFQSAISGQITAIRYWKAPSETGTHTGKIWSATGTVLATVTFANETASGWQQQALTTPLNIQANTTYVVSVNINSYFPITYDQLATSIVNGNLSSIADGNNGVIATNVDNFPTLSFRNSNYFRDIVFVAGGISTITKVSGDNQTGNAGATLPNPLVVQIKDSAGNPLSGVTVNFAVTAGGGSVSPSSAVTGSNGQASTVLTLGSIPGGINPVTNTVSATASSVGTITFSATANPIGVTTETVFTTQTPSNPNATDGVSYELGMKFKSAKSGQIAAIRHWKASSETGTHVGKIWSATGTVLATVTFTNEGVSGWQQQSLSTPLEIQPNTTYVVSVNVNNYFPIAYNQLASSIVNGNLSSIADGNNGVFATDVNTFPTLSFQNSNYFRDVVFVSSSVLIKVSGDNQTGKVGTTLTNALVVQVNDSAGNPLAGVTVNFVVTSGGGSLSVSSVVTGSNGQASTVLTLGTLPSGPKDAVIVTATAIGIGSVAFSAKATPASPNAIFIENQNTGTLNWRITNPVTESAPEILAYAAVTSVNQGGSVPIKVSLAQAGTFTIDVYRLGYYGGTGGRFILSTGLLSGTNQSNSTVIDSTTNLVECNWSTSYTVAVGANWTSGLYVVNLTDQVSGKQTQTWFVVRNDSSTSDILFNSSFNTFQAYNNSGGYSLYPWNSIGGQRAFKVSYDRPYSQVSTRTVEANKILTWEYNMMRWLESQSYNVSYVTNLDVQSNPQLLQQHKVYLSVGHDEYWSLEQRNNIEQARDASSPTNLAFFAANVCYWRVRFENSNTGQSNRVMACYKDNWSQDPVAPTNKFRSSQNNRPENALLGVMYTGDNNDFYGGANFTVTNSTDPYYANTNLNNGDSLTQLVGFEWDAVVNNGSTPSGLVVLSQTTVFPGEIDTDLPAGTNTQIANAVRYTASSGAKVFAVGSMQWMWGLDSDGVSTPREDVRAKQIAVNVLSDLKAKPQTPDANIVVP